MTTLWGIYWGISGCSAWKAISNAVAYQAIVSPFLGTIGVDSDVRSNPPTSRVTAILLPIATRRVVAESC
jgi:hypothetical protein